MITIPETHHCKLHFRRECLCIEQCLKDDDTRRGHGLNYLVCADRVCFKRQICQNNKPTESHGDWNHLAQRKHLHGEDAKQSADKHSNWREDKVDQSERHVRKEEIRVDGFVQKHDRYREGNVEYETESNVCLAVLHLLRLIFGWSGHVADHVRVKASKVSVIRVIAFVLISRKNLRNITWNELITNMWPDRKNHHKVGKESKPDLTALDWLVE